MQSFGVFDLSGHTVLVTGSSQNLGFSIAVAFARSQAQVILHGPRVDDVDEARQRLCSLVPEARLATIAFDLADADAISSAFASLEQQRLTPDILVNNAAHLGLGKSGFLEQSPDFFREVMEVNLFGAFRCSQLAASAMSKRGEGHIIHISSLAGERAIWSRSAYNTSKAALDGLTRSMALELAPAGIRVNSISPGYVWTPRWDHLDKETEERRRKNTPTSDPTGQDEIAQMVLFLCSGATPSLTGTTIVIDGGLNIQQVPRDVSV